MKLKIKIKGNKRSKNSLTKVHHFKINQNILLLFLINMGVTCLYIEPRS